MSPSNLKFDHIETPVPESLAEEAIQIFAGVMADDPAVIALTGGNMSLLPTLGGVMFRALVLTPGVGDLFVARDEHGTLVGYTLFSLPGQLVLSTPEQQKHGLLDFMAKLSPEGQKYYPETMMTEVPKANDAALGIQEAERNTYWCNFAMVRADYQNKGVARTLFELATKEAAKTRATMALTATNIQNVPVYEKLGFRLHGHTVIPSPWVNWDLWFFSKETRTKDETRAV